ncbi:MAG: DNA methyltransferase, partial [Nitrososphaerales archaeon]
MGKPNSPYKVIRGKGESKITLFHKDCVRGIRENLRERSVDVVVTSPPYNIGIEYGKHRDNLPREKYLLWMEEVGKEVKHILK